ncbi:MAG: ribonuclease Z [Bacteroidota bacterium]
MNFELTTLGTSAAYPTPRRWASAQYLRTPRHGLLIDCAEGTQIALAANGIGWSSVDTILISHLHGDHCYGLPGLLTSWSLLQRDRSLRLVGPPGLQELLTTVFRLSHTGLPYAIEYLVVDPAAAPAIVCKDKHICVQTLPLRHRVPTVGYLVREQARPRSMRAAAIEQYSIPYQQIPAIKAGADFQTATGQIVPNTELTAPAPPRRSFAYCSDTIYLPGLAEIIQGVDLLSHEATFLHEMAEHAHSSGHSTAQQAAQLAAAAQVGRLVIDHFSPRYLDLGPLLAEARAVFSATHLSAEGKVFDVPYAGRQVE